MFNRFSTGSFQNVINFEPPYQFFLRNVASSLVDNTMNDKIITVERKSVDEEKFFPLVALASVPPSSSKLWLKPKQLPVYAYDFYLGASPRDLVTFVTLIVTPQNVHSTIKDLSLIHI